jgi:hypothetical protein
MPRPMEEKEVKIWSEILKRCGVRRHPKDLGWDERKIQILLLDYMSMNPNCLPDRTRWMEWYQWHVDNNDKGKQQ